MDQWLDLTRRSEMTEGRPRRRPQERRRRLTYTLTRRRTGETSL